MPDINITRCYHRTPADADGVVTNSMAIYSDDGNKSHRYLLERIWNPRRPVLMFVMSHPSQATVINNEDDPTVEICERFARLYPNNSAEKIFGGIYITNVFAFMPREQRVDDPIGTENDRIIREYAGKARGDIICAWGDNCRDSRFPERRNHIEAILREEVRLRMGEGTLYCFGQKPNGNPKHPLELVDNVAAINDFAIRNLDFMEWPADR